jgi:hypothetical protein
MGASLWATAALIIAYGASSQQWRLARLMEACLKPCQCLLLCDVSASSTAAGRMGGWRNRTRPP